MQYYHNAASPCFINYMHTFLDNESHRKGNHHHSNKPLIALIPNSILQLRGTYFHNYTSDRKLFVRCCLLHHVGKIFQMLVNWHVDLARLDTPQLKKYLLHGLATISPCV